MANLIIKSSADNLVLQGSDASPAITVGATGTTTFAEVATFTGRDVHNGGITIADAGNIGSASDLDAISIAANGNVTISQNLTVSGTATITGSQSRLVGISWHNANADGKVITLENSKTYDCWALSLGTNGPDQVYSVIVVNGSGGVTQTNNVTATGIIWISGTNSCYVDESVGGQEPNVGLVFERGATFDNS